MVVLKTFDIPQTIYIVGVDYQEKPEAFSITDDEHLCLIENNKKQTAINTQGFVFILSEEEFINWEDLLWESPEDYEYTDGVCLKNFTGNICLKVIDKEGNDILTDSIFQQKEYLRYTTGLHGLYEDAVIVLHDDYDFEVESVKDLYENVKY
jgi:hypothetical protein